MKKQHLIAEESAMCNENHAERCLQQAKEKSGTDGQPSGLGVDTIPWPAGAVVYL